MTLACKLHGKKERRDGTLEKRRNAAQLAKTLRHRSDATLHSSLRHLFADLYTDEMGEGRQGERPGTQRR